MRPLQNTGDRSPLELTPTETLRTRAGLYPDEYHIAIHRATKGLAIDKYCDFVFDTRDDERGAVAPGTNAPSPERGVLDQ